MFEQYFRELEIISKAVGSRADYVQGGGGNTSVKLDGSLMAVKASGFKLNQITPAQGFVIVNYGNIKAYYEGVDLKQDKDFEKESVETARKNVVEMEGLPVLRPSVEAGFHSIMKKYVIHTHPVYANILCCSAEGRDTVARLFKGRDYAFLWIPYINPGFCLTQKIKDEIEKCIALDGRFPEVVFMENHGLVVTSDSYERAVSLHEEVNSLIKQQLGLKEDYPDIKLEARGESEFISNTGYLTDFFTSRRIDADFFERYSLYPDQLVYLNSSLSVDGSENKLNVDTKTGERLYKTNYSEALTIEETLLGYAYVINGIGRCGLEIKAMSGRDIDFIKNWESEAYRKSLVRELTK
ncbi:MAG TPA: class II aldolase/adducin family protein [Clostridia bacterium]|nr:class II aldolase/adducin family protein [Clostridia bacterium]